MNILNSVKEASQKSEEFAQKKQIREAVNTAEIALSLWAENPRFWERLLGKILIGDLIEKLQGQLIGWRKQVVEADKLISRANLILSRDTADPYVTQGIANAIALYQLCSTILIDEQVSESIKQCQQELQKRHQFQALVRQAQLQVENRFFKNAIAIYQEAEKLYITESVKQAFTDALTQVPQEEIYNSALQKAQQAESEGKLRGAMPSASAAIALLDSALTNFPRADGLDLLQKLKSTVQGKELFRQGLTAEQAGDFFTAKYFYENAHPLLENPQDCQIRLGLVAIKMQDWVSALSYLRGLSGEQAAYLRGFALAHKGNLQLAYKEWQQVSSIEINIQRETIKRIFQHQYLSSLHNIEQLVKSKNWEKAKIASREFIQKFGVNNLVENNLKQHIEPILEAEVWKDSDWANIATKMKNAWIANPNIISLHNWTVATYYHAQSHPETLFDLIIALSTALANLTANPIIQDLPWLGNKKVDLILVSSALKQLLETEIEKIKNINTKEYLKLRDFLRWESVAQKLMSENSSSGMQVNDVFITPGCYQKFSAKWQNTIVYKIHSNQKLLHSLYTPWGLAIAACIEGDRQRAIQLKPVNKHTIEVEQFARNFVAYHEGCYYFQQEKWQNAVIFWHQAKAEIQENQDWQKEVDKLCNHQRQIISEFEEHLQFAEFWYDLIDSSSAVSYLAEYKAEEIRQKLTNKQISPSQAQQKLQELTNIDSNNPVVNDIIENLEIDQEIEEIHRLFKNRQHAEMIRKARNSKRDRVRYIIAEFFIDALIEKMKEGNSNDPEIILQLGRWAYQICPDAPTFQEIYQGLKLC
jgi:hypothetical protein